MPLTQAGEYSWRCYLTPPPGSKVYKGDCVFDYLGDGVGGPYFCLPRNGSSMTWTINSNHVELWATFGNTPLTDDDRLGEGLPQLAPALGECWQGVLSARYPNRQITVEVSDEEDGSYGPTVTFRTSSAVSAFGK